MQKKTVNQSCIRNKTINSLGTFFSQTWNAIKVSLLFSLCFIFFQNFRGKFEVLYSWKNFVGSFQKYRCFSLNLFLLERYNDIFFNIDIKRMTIDLLREVMYSTNCFVMVLDEYYQHIIGSGFNEPMDYKPYFKVIIIMNIFMRWRYFY